MTVVGVMAGDEGLQGVAAFDVERVIRRGELWRLGTGSTYLGPPSISLLMDFYYLLSHGSLLETSCGTAQFGAFLAFQVALLAGLAGVVFRTPFFAQSVVTAMLHAVSREDPHKPVKWLLFSIPSWTLPFAFMAGDVLNAKSCGAAVPHIMGILTGHAYVFQKKVNVQMGGEDWLTAPEYLKRKFDVDGAERKNGSGEGESTMESIKRKRRGR